MSKVFRRWLFVNLAVLGLFLLVTIASLVLLRRDIIARAANTIEERNLYFFRSEGVKALSSLREESKQGEAYKNELYSILPKEEELFAFTRNLDRFARARGLNMNFSFGSKQEASGNIAASISFTLGVEGQFQSILRFFEDIEKEKLLVKFNAVDIARAGGTYTAKVSGQLFTREMISS